MHDAKACVVIARLHHQGVRKGLYFHELLSLPTLAKSQGIPLAWPPARRRGCTTREHTRQAPTIAWQRYPPLGQRQGARRFDPQ